MTEQEWLERLDAHLERGEETMRLLRADHQDLKQFIRDQNTRMERVVQRFERRSLAAEKRFAERMDDAGDQLRANTAATWAMVDEITSWRK